MEQEKDVIRTLSQVLSRSFRNFEGRNTPEPNAAATAAATPANYNACAKNDVFWFGGKKVSKHKSRSRERTYGDLVCSSLRQIAPDAEIDTTTASTSSACATEIPPMLELVRQISATAGVPGSSEKISRAYIEQELFVYAYLWRDT